MRALVLLVLLAGPAAASECREDLAELRWDGGQARFTVELADDFDERAIGLMHRTSLPAAAGMLFAYEQSQNVAFWMRNTLIALDMVFIDETGTVVGVHANAVPGDETPIPSKVPVQFVLEIGGGLAARIGIAPGAQLRHPAITPQIAAWPCD